MFRENEANVMAETLRDRQPPRFEGEVWIAFKTNILVAKVVEINHILHKHMARGEPADRGVSVAAESAVISSEQMQEDI